MVSLSSEGPCSITTKAEKYTHCRDKRPTDSRNHACCYLEANNESIKRCVEVRKIDIDSKDDFNKLEDEIKKGTYDFWLADNYTGFEEYRNGSIQINEIESLRCNKENVINLRKYIFLLILIFIL